MKKLILGVMALVMLILLGCSNPIKEALIGKWLVYYESSEEYIPVFEFKKNGDIIYLKDFEDALRYEGLFNHINRGSWGENYHERGRYEVENDTTLILYYQCTDLVDNKLVSDKFILKILSIDEEQLEVLAADGEDLEYWTIKQCSNTFLKPNSKKVKKAIEKKEAEDVIADAEAEIRYVENKRRERTMEYWKRVKDRSSEYHVLTSEVRIITHPYRTYEDIEKAMQAIELSGKLTIVATYTELGVLPIQSIEEMEDEYILHCFCKVDGKTYDFNIPQNDISDMKVYFHKKYFSNYESFKKNLMTEYCSDTKTFQVFTGNLGWDFNADNFEEVELDDYSSLEKGK